MRVLQKSWIFTILLVVCLGWTASAAASPAAVGIATYDHGEGAAWGTAGWPDMEFGAVVGQSSLADVGGRLRLSYGDGQTFGGFGAQAAALLRLRVANVAGWAVGLVCEPAVFVHGGAANWAPYVKANGSKTVSLFGLEPGLPWLAAGTWLAPELYVAFALGVPLRVHLAPETTLEVPVLARVSAQYPLTKQWALVAGTEAGVAFFGPGAGAPTYALNARLRVGLVWGM